MEADDSIKEDPADTAEESVPELEAHSEEVQALLTRTGYQIERYPTCRAYGGPPPGFTGDEPSDDCQVCNNSVTVNFIKNRNSIR